MTVDELAKTLEQNISMIQRDLYAVGVELAAAEDRRDELLRELDRQQGALFALGKLDTEGETGAEDG